MLFVMGNFILLNLFLAILLHNFEDDNKSSEQIQEDEDEE